MNTGIVYSDKYLEHDLGPDHPEKPERLKSIIESLKREEKLLEKIDIFEPSPASIEDIKLAHTPAYIEKIKKLSKSGRRVDLDTPINKKTFDLALLSAGGTLQLGEKTLKGKFGNGFALVRPPGHHATRDSGGGFCYFNNIAITARKLLKEDEIDRVLIFDFDAHHGNGTQDIFYQDNNLLYISFHQSGRTLYPGTGSPKETGEKDGEGYTVNVPFPPGSSDENYVAALKKFLIPLSEQFEPDFILSSVGLDGHRKDPLTNLRLSSKGYEWLGKTSIDQASKLCDGKIVFVLEGGYAIDASTKSVLKIMNALVNPSSPDLPKGEKKPVFEKVKENLSPYWDL
ncbi:hypothetical protein AKJ53_00605 [candidate division MSBL1 archaeon SCGC-AAA382F02]|uniref:Histone deacetylase domain-containing protein n=1 Tax=candidate division MSBL1 archaeon SCGC-AAA382F02 TaxID=1698282 RepID=A0A133VIT6_9EURY|nr:hypothetical protein AKJ53_00605 [candidate division MSBL1 archaeon SCGC-AAA382F02]